MNFLRNRVGRAGLITWCETPLSHPITERRQAVEKACGFLVGLWPQPNLSAVPDWGTLKGPSMSGKSGKEGLISAPFQELRRGEERARRRCVCTCGMCARLQAGLIFLVGGVGRGLDASVETALASFINCFSHYYLLSVIFSSKIIVDDNGNDADGDHLGVWMGFCCGRTPDPSMRHLQEYPFGCDCIDVGRPAFTSPSPSFL